MVSGADKVKEEALNILNQKTTFVSAGDAITAKLVKEAGFDGIWVSGFEVTARMGLKDDGRITMTEMIIASRPIIQSTKLPVIIDVDTGYSNFERTIIEFELLGAFGICVEDNLPDKENSLFGGAHELLPASEFSKKIEAVRKRKIKIIARTEALIRGKTLSEATRQSPERYRKAGI